MHAKTISPADMAKTNSDVKGVPAPDNKIDVKPISTLHEAMPANEAPAMVIERANRQKPQLIQQVNELCERFINVREGSKIVQLIRGRESTYAERSVKALSKLLNFIWTNQHDVHVLDAFRKFMVQQRGKHLACENALQGINLITSEMERGRYTIMYMLMYELTNPDRLRNDYDFIYAEKVCRNDQCSPANGYIQFISSRLR